MSNLLDIPTPRVFVPLLQTASLKGAYGGRGSGKSMFFADLAIEYCVNYPGARGLCFRETQNSLKESVKALIEDEIQRLNVGHLFDCQEKIIRTPGNGQIIFLGMQNHTVQSVQSLQGIDFAWGEEAQAISKKSLRVLLPTLRKDVKGDKPASQFWFSWNPNKNTDPVDLLFRGPDVNPNDKDIISVCANWRENPYFPNFSEKLRQRDLNKPDYGHIWEGEYLTASDAVIFKNRITITPFETPAGARFFHGADWGFSIDPSTLIRAYVLGDCLYVDQEAWGHSVELDEIPQLFDSIPTSRKWPIKADCSQPQTISHVRRRGFNITPADKWAGSVEDGITCLKGFRQIIVHPRCVNIAKEFRLYSYKTDPKTDDVLPIIVDKHNHGIDALRYALDGYIKGGAGMHITDEMLRQF